MFLGSKVRPVRGADNLTAIYGPIIYTTWNPQHLTTEICQMTSEKIGNWDDWPQTQSVDALM
jgi:hypothetical protein